MSLHLAQQKAFWAVQRRQEERQALANESRKRREMWRNHAKGMAEHVAAMFERSAPVVEPAQKIGVPAPPPPEAPKPTRTKKTRRGKGFVELLVTVAVWGVYLLLAVPFEHRLGIDWAFARSMQSQFNAPVGLAFLGFYGVQFWGLRKLDDNGAFRNGRVMALPVGFVLFLWYCAAHAP